MNTIVKNTDKWLHALASALIVCAAFLVLAGLGMNGVLAAVLAAVVSVLAGLGKEFVIDVWIQHETAEVGDLIADGIGILVGIVPVVLFLVL